MCRIVNYPYCFVQYRKISYCRSQYFLYMTVCSFMQERAIMMCLSERLSCSSESHDGTTAEQGKRNEDKEEERRRSVNGLVQDAKGAVFARTCLSFDDMGKLATGEH